MEELSLPFLKRNRVTILRSSVDIVYSGLAKDYLIFITRTSFTEISSQITS